MSRLKVHVLKTRNRLNRVDRVDLNHRRTVDDEIYAVCQAKCKNCSNTWVDTGSNMCFYDTTICRGCLSEIVRKLLMGV